MAKRKPTQHEVNRIIVGNQLTIMRLLVRLDPMTPAPLQQVVRMRVYNIKSWWKSHFDEDIGFEPGLGDERD